MLLLPYVSTDFSEDLKLLFPIINHLVAPIEMPRPPTAWGWHWNHFDFLAGAAYGCLGLSKNPDKLFLSSIFLHFHFLVATFQFPNVLNFTSYIFATVFIMNCTHSHCLHCGKCTKTWLFFSIRSYFYKPDWPLWLVTCCLLLLYDTCKGLLSLLVYSISNKEQNPNTRIHVERQLEEQRSS